MKKIIFPLEYEMQRPEVADLQDALLMCLDRSAILSNDEVSRRKLTAALKRELIKQIYGDTTSKLVSIFQEERRLQSSGEVDKTTDNELNALLKEWWLLYQPLESPTPRTFVITTLSHQMSQDEDDNNAVLDLLLDSDYTIDHDSGVRKKKGCIPVRCSSQCSPCSHC
jgi:hypothetical protein